MAVYFAEEWRAIPGHEGRYEVSDLGRVRSLLPYQGKTGPRLLSIRQNQNGYAAVRLRVEGRDTLHLVHRLVMEAFVGPLPAGMETRHLNGVRTDARLANLAYGTHAENMQDAIRHGTHRSARPTCREGHKLEGDNLRVTYEAGKKRHRVCRTCDNARREAKRREAGIGPRVKLPSRAERLAADPSIVEHGRSATYTNWGCRCDECRAAHSAERREQRRRANQGAAL